MAWKRWNPNPQGLMVGDCTVRAICTVTGRGWNDVHRELCDLSRLMADMPSSDRVWWEMLQSKGDVKMSDIIDAIGQISEPMLEMSMLQSLNDLLDSVGYAKEEGLSALSQTLSSAVTSYLTQAIPTLSGQIERTHEKLRMTTYTDKNKWLTKNMQYTLGKISAKIPGWDYDQIPYIDAWGRTEDADESWVKRLADNAVHPWYSDQTDMSEMEKELLRLYNVDPDKYGSVLHYPGQRRIRQRVKFSVLATPN